MTTLLTGVETSPVQIEDRRILGIKPGDTVKVHQKIVDKGKTRLQVFEGIVLARKHGDEAGATFTVRKVSQGIGVEKIFPLYTPLIEKIEIVKRAKVRRAKLYYIREKVTREIKRQMRRMSLVSMATESETEATNRLEAESAVTPEITPATKVETLSPITATTKSVTEPAEEIKTATVTKVTVDKIFTAVESEEKEH